MNKKNIGIILSVLLLVLILVILFINFKNNSTNYFKRINSFKDITNNKVEFELMDDIIPVVDTERIEVNLRYKNIHENPNKIYFDLYRIEINENDYRFYPNKSQKYSRLSIVHQDLKPVNQVMNVVVNNLNINNDIIDAEIRVINNKDEYKLLKSGVNLIEKGDIINIRFNPLPEFQKVLFDKNEINKFFMVLNLSLDKNDYDSDNNTLKTIPFELKFKKNIYYSLGLILTNNNDKIITKYVSRKHKNKPLTIYSDEVGKNELHNIELVNPNNSTKEYTHWNSQTNNKGYLIRSLNDDNKMYYKINKDGNVILVYSKKPFDLLNFERTNTGLYHIHKVKDSIYANNNFQFIIKKDEYGRFKNINTNQLEEAGHFDIKENKNNIKDIQNLSDYIDNSLKKAVPTEEPGVINYSYLQRGFTIDDIKLEHNSGAVLSSDGGKHLSHITKHDSDKLILVQFSNLSKEDEYNDKFILNINTNESVSEFYIYIKHDGINPIDLSKISTKYNKDINNENNSVSFYEDGKIINSLRDRGHFLDNVDKSKGYNKDRYIFYGIGSTDGIIEKYNIFNNKYKNELHEGQTIIDSSNNKRYIHIIREHIPMSIRSLQLERLLISIPVNLVNFNEDETHTLSKEIKVNMLNDKLYPGETIESYYVIFDEGTILQQLKSCSDSVILNNLNKILLSENDNYDIISINHPDYQKIKFGKCDNIMNRDDDIKEMQHSNNFSKSILDNLVKKSGDILSRRSFELSNIHAHESSLLEQNFIKDYNNYEKNNLIDTNPYSNTDEIINYYDIKGKEGFQDSIMKNISVSDYFGTYRIYPGQFILIDNLELQIDERYIGFIDKGIPIMKFTHDNILSIYSPFNAFEGIKFRIIAQDKMVHTFATTNLEKLLFNTGLRSPNFIYLSKHDTLMKNGDIKSIYRLSNREYTTLFQMKKK